MYPKISVITPSFNQAQFIEQTILSVIGQTYPNLEYIIMDGGSTDGTVEIIKRYQKHLAHWESKPDNGQAAAINKGSSLATGDILCWLNSDDMYLPGALFEAANHLRDFSAPVLLFGNCLHFRENDPDFSRGSNVRKKQISQNIRFVDYIIQPSFFTTRKGFLTVGPLSEHYHFVFDWEWFIRAADLGIKFTVCDKFLSLYRMHPSHKTGQGGDRRWGEIEEIYRKYNGEKALLALRRSLQIKNKFGRWSWAKRLLKYNSLVHFIFFRTMVSLKEYKSIKNVN
jgi:glycosyltransferase involved in cell wall biosynthesis